MGLDSSSENSLIDQFFYLFLPL